VAKKAKPWERVIARRELLELVILPIASKCDYGKGGF
jgi:hypothetical protein